MTDILEAYRARCKAEKIVAVEGENAITERESNDPIRTQPVTDVVADLVDREVVAGPYGHRQRIRVRVPAHIKVGPNDVVEVTLATADGTYLCYHVSTGM